MNANILVCTLSTGQIALKSKQESKPKPARKRGRATSEKSEDSLPAKAAKRTKGKLQVFMNMPVEVFIEVSTS
jgi:hypothetical protein